MKINIKILALLLLIQGCSYELINSPNKEKIFVQTINVNGDTRSAFIIKKSVMRKSNKEGKKLKAVIYNKRTVHLRQAGSSDFTKHKDEDKKERYLARHKKRGSYQIWYKSRWVL